MRSGDEVNLEAGRQVEAFIKLLRVRFGITEIELPVLINALKKAAEMQDTFKRLRFHATVIAMGIVIAALLGVIWIGFQTKLFSG